MSAQARFEALSRQKLAPVGAASPTGRRSIAALKEIFSHREMLSLLVRRDLKSRYKDSALGFVWTLIRPLTQLFIYYIVIGKFLSAERGIPEFAVYVFTGLTAYGLLSEIIGGGTASIVGNAGLIKKVYLPREVFPLASVGSALFNFAIQLGILLIFTAILGSFPWSPDFFYFFPALLVLLVYGTAFALLLSALNVYLRDIQYLVEVLLLLLLWASPIVYSWSMVKDILGPSLALEIYTDNPITLAVLGFQKAFWMGGQATAEYPAGLALRLGIAFVIGLVLLVSFQRVFQRLQGNFAQAL
ncbi:ABC transporter permease [Leifsonia sp. 1010]|uniref:ABC transporter permease n=1 Tax=Leifsonia sp. 1010 TaxID=2817769 RepID=UPI002854CD1D|nr:ABC transporter permease [Leifsonia sp. 1010]MDR6612394.1 ABC-2 type transport system permease protein [Leifsonia sp. 1010]